MHAAGGGEEVPCFCLFVCHAFERYRVCANSVFIKPFEFGNNFDIFGQGKLCTFYGRPM